MTPDNICASVARVIHPTILAAGLLVIAGCGGGSSSLTGGNTASPPVTPNPPASCDGYNLITVVGATDNGLRGMSNGPEKAIDDNLDPGSRSVFKTSANSSYTRSELREMLRRGDTSISTRGVTRNNWVLGYQPNPGVAVGGRNGVLRGTLTVNHVTETGDRNQVGRVIIGQIHAASDEPIRLYFRKYPEDARGFIYFAHEIRDSDDLYFPVLGPVNSNPSSSPVRSDHWPQLR